MYTLRFPFSISQNFIIKGVDTENQLGNLTYRLQNEDPFYILTISGFPTEAEANSYIKKTRNGLIWMLLNCRLPFKADFKPESVLLIKNSSIEKYSINGNKPAIYQSSKQKTIITGYAPTISITDTTIDNLLKFINEGISFPTNEKIASESKLDTALDLYGAHFTEFTLNAKFLTLVLALEALKPKHPPTQITLTLINKYIKQTKKLQKRVNKDKSKLEDIESLETLITSLQNICKKSLGNAIKHLVLTTLKNNRDKDAEDMAKRAKKIYGLRGTLVHEGKLEPSELYKATEDAKNIVERVLKAKFIELANENS